MRIGFKRYDPSTAKKFTRLPLGLRVGALSGLGLLGRRVLKAAPAYGRFYALGPPKTMTIQAPDHRTQAITFFGLKHCGVFGQEDLYCKDITSRTTRQRAEFL